MIVASVLTSEVPAGVGVIDLYEDICSELGEGTDAKIFARQFSKIVARDPEQFERTLFDIQMAKASLKFFDAGFIPRVTLDQGVSRARWVADLEGVPEARENLLGGNRLTKRSTAGQAE